MTCNHLQIQTEPEDRQNLSGKALDAHTDRYLDGRHKAQLPDMPQGRVPAPACQLYLLVPSRLMELLPKHCLHKKHQHSASQLAAVPCCKRIKVFAEEVNDGTVTSDHDHSQC